MSVTNVQSCCPRAARPFYCNECGKLIPAGEVHLQTTYTTAGEDFETVAHMDCALASDHLNDGGLTALAIEEHLEASRVETSNFLRLKYPGVAERFADKLAGVN